MKSLLKKAGQATMPEEPLPEDQVHLLPKPVPPATPVPLQPSTQPRVPPGERRELGLFGWLFCKLSARVWGVPKLHLFTVLAQHRRLFWSWALFNGTLLYRGRLPKPDTELVVLRVAHLRGSAYELQQHRRVALRRGIDEATQAQIFTWPNSVDLAPRQQALLAGVDELLAARTMSDGGWQLLADHLDRRQLIEFVTLVGLYDALAMALSTLGVPLDYPD